MPEQIRGLIHSKGTVLGFIVHEAFHQFQLEAFGEIPWEREARYLFLDVEIPHWRCWRCASSETASWLPWRGDAAKRFGPWRTSWRFASPVAAGEIAT